MEGSPGRLRRFGKFALWTTGGLLVASLSGALGMLAVVYAMVYFGDDSQLKKSTILARINEETNIYMLDGETQVGSIFANAHRRYVPIDEVPAHMINALIAAEDKNFYHHNGVDPVAIASAGMGVLKGGRMRGASTLTQQTVRNILGWWEVTLARKFREMIAALQLERLYDKKQILEFYLNQFYVSGNGNGIGIAARYYFNKDVRDLDLVEAAFIAGSVKGPSAYDPFIKFTKERRERALTNANHRKNYVLRRMFEQGWISEEQFKTAWDTPVKFIRGRFRSEEVAIVNIVRAELAQKEVMQALGIEEPQQLTAAGLKIFTTIDPEMQASAQQAVRRNLSRLETILKGFKPEAEEFFKKERGLVVDNFYYGRVTDVAGTDKEPELKLNFGLPNGVVPYDSLMRYAKIMDLPWGKGWQKQLQTLLKEIKPGDLLYVEVKSYDPETHEAVVELHKRPRVNGGLIAIDKGEVRAVISGFDTRGFNRALAAKRQPGSVFKSVVFFAAMQLGWSVLDRLDNERQIFPYQGQFYYPRPDHDSPYKDVSLLWAGIMSENLGSVALTTRLVEKLNLDQFKQLMGVMDLLPHSGEAPRDYHYRVARYIGVSLDNEGVREFQLTNAANDLVLDVQYTSTFEFQQRLKKMWWGRGYAPELNAIHEAKDDLTASQKAQKIKLLQNNFVRMQLLDQALVEDWKFIESTVQQKGADEAFLDPGVQQRLDRFRVLPGLSKPALGYVIKLEQENLEKPSSAAAEIDKLLAPQGRQLNGLDMSAIWGSAGLFGSAEIQLTDVQLDGWLPHGNFLLLNQYIDAHYNEVMARQEDFELNKYFQHHDFRIGLGLKYLVNLTKAMGVSSKLEPVQSYPLGVNDVTLAEVAKIYQTFISGKTYKFFEDGPANQLNFIRRIEDRFGNVLFEPKRREIQLVQPEYGFQMREILRRVVTHGTGRRAHGELYLTLEPEVKASKGKKEVAEKRVRIPAFGKTGTTNDYTNANFAGFMPYPTEKGAPLDPANSYVIAAYTGYDLNKKMEAGFMNISGSQGALPAWIGLAKDTIDKKKFVEMVDPLDLNVVAQHEWPLVAEKAAVAARVDMPRGVMMDRGGSDEETGGMTDISRDGESAFDEFRANVVQATLRLPLDSSGAPLRLFAPFKADDKDLKNGLLGVEPSRIDPAPAATGAPGAQGAPVSISQQPQIPGKGQVVNDAGQSGNAVAAPLTPKPLPEDGDASDEALERSFDEMPETTGDQGAGEKQPSQKSEELFKPEEGPSETDESGKDKDGFVEEELW